MYTFLRKVRGALGMGLTWGATWGTIAATLGVVIGVFDPASIDPGESPLVMGAVLGIQGFVAGVGFGVFLSFAEARKKILDLSLPRVALLGTLAAAALPVVSGAPPGMLWLLCPLGALCASATVAIARRGARAEDAVGVRAI